MTAHRFVVYRCFDASGRLIYIGSSGDLEQRLAAHAASSWWYSLADRVDIEPYPTIAAARAAEFAAIKSELPAFNCRHTGPAAQIRLRLTDADRATCRAWNRDGGYLPLALRPVVAATEIGGIA